MHQNGADDGPAPPHTAPPRLLTPHADPAPPPHADRGPGPHPETAHAKLRPARTKYRGFSAEHQAMLHRADAVIADTREMLARLEADALLEKLLASPHLRLVGGTEWSDQ
jgi:hypothetical protein